MGHEEQSTGAAAAPGADAGMTPAGGERSGQHSWHTPQVIAPTAVSPQSGPRSASQHGARRGPLASGEHQPAPHIAQATPMLEDPAAIRHDRSTIARMLFRAGGLLAVFVAGFLIVPQFTMELFSWLGSGGSPRDADDLILPAGLIIPALVALVVAGLLFWLGRARGGVTARDAAHTPSLKLPIALIRIASFVGAGLLGIAGLFGVLATISTVGLGFRLSDGSGLIAGVTILLLAHAALILLVTWPRRTKRAASGNQAERSGLAPSASPWAASGTAHAAPTPESRADGRPGAGAAMGASPAMDPVRQAPADGTPSGYTNASGASSDSGTPGA